MTKEQIDALDITGVENRMAEIGKLLDSDDADLDALTEEVEALEARKKALQEAAQKRTALRSQVAAGAGVVKTDESPKEGRSAVAERLVNENRMTLPMFRENRSVLVSSGEYACRQYMRICCLGVIAIALYNCIASILRGLGDSRTPLYFLIVASVLNVVLDLVFVCVFHWGVAGAGVATIISQLLSGVGSLTLSIRRNAYFHLTKESFRFNRNIIFQTVRIGVPMAAQSSLIAFSCVILQSVVNSFGSSVVAAFTATSRVEQLVQQPYMSLSTAISTFTGQNIGAGKKDRVRLGASRGLIMILVFTCVMMPLIWIFSHPIIGLFVTDKEVIRLGAHALHLTSPFYFPLSIIYVYRGLLNGAGDAMFSFLNGVTECAGRIAFPKPLTMISQIGVWGIWLGTALTWLLVAIVTFLRYRSGAWKKISLQGRSA